MSERKTKKPRNPRRTFTIQEQLIGKVGREEFGRLLDGLHRSAAKPKRRRRGRGRRKAVAA